MELAAVMDSSVVALGVGAVLATGALAGAALALTHRPHVMDRLLMAAYMTVAALAIVGGVWKLSDTTTLVVAIAALAVFWMAGRALYLLPHPLPDGPIPWRAAIMGAAVAGCVTSLALPILAAADVVVPGMSESIARVFAGAPDRVVWAALPLLVSLILRR